MAQRGIKTLAESLARIRTRISMAPPYYLSRLPPPQASSSSTPEEYKTRRLRLDQFREKHPQDVDGIKYSRFVSALYPVTSSMGRFSQQEPNIALVNHSKLLDTYSHLPRPGVAYIQPQDFERFMAVMIDRRDFVRPNSLSPTSRYYYLDEQMIQAFCSAQRSRKAHLANFWKVARDMNEANVPVTRHEQRQLLYMTLYKERPDILQMVTDAYENLNKSLENYLKYAHMYKSANSNEYSSSTLALFRDLFRDDWDVDTLNMFLFTAFRHGDEVTFKKFLRELKEMKPNRKTFLIILEKYASSGDVSLFSSWLQVLATEYPHLVEIKLFNTIVKSLTLMKFVEHAQKLVSVFAPDKFRPLEPHEIFLKQLTIDDRETYNNYWKAYEESQSVENFSLYPTEEMFLPLISAYCNDLKVDFDTILGLLYQAELVWGIPITTRMFKLLFHSFRGSRHSVANLKFITGKLIASHDVSYGNNEAWIKSQLLSIELPSNVMGVLNLLIDEDYADTTPSQGCFIKLSDELVHVVYMAFDHCLQNMQTEQKLAAKAYKEYLKRLTEARQEYRRSMEPDATLLDLNARDEFMYIKKGFIIDLLDIIT